MDGRPQTKGIIVIRFGSAFRRHACIDLATPETQTPENAPRPQAAKLLYQFAPHLAERRSVHQQHARLIEPDVPVRRLEPEAFMKAVLLDQAVFIHRSAPASSPRICFSLSFESKQPSLKGPRALATQAGQIGRAEGRERVGQ